VQLLSQPTVARNIILVGAGQETCTVDNDKQRANMGLTKGTVCLVNIHTLIRNGDRLSVYMHKQ